MAIGARATKGTWGAAGAPRAAAFALGGLSALALALTAAPAASAAGCPNEARRAEQGALVEALPDCRAYELVSPAAKDGGEPGGPLSNNSREREDAGVSGARAALDGGRLTWVSEYLLPQSSLIRPYKPGTPGLQYLSVRSGDGWSSENVIPPQSIAYGLACPTFVGIVGWSSALARGLLADGISQESGLSPGGGFQGERQECGHDEPRLAADQPTGLEQRAGSQNLFLREEGGSAFRLVNPTPQGAPVPRPAFGNQEYFPASFLAASDDLRHVAFEEELPLTADAEQISGEVEEACEGGERGCWESHDNLYEWSESASGAAAVSLVTILPGGEPVEGSLAGATRNNGGGGRYGPTETAFSPLRLTPNVANFRHAVSADGSRIFFEAGGNLYVRESGTSTVQIDAAQSGLPSAADGGGEFMAASADGSTVYFTADASHLLTTDTLPAGGQNLYECELPSEDGKPCKLTNLTPAVEAGVLGVSGTNEGTKDEAGDPYVYFVAKGALTAGEPAAGKVPVPGEANLYLYHGGTNVFIATLDDSEKGTDPEGEPCSSALAIGSCSVTFTDSCDWTSRGGCEFGYGNGELQSAKGGLTARVSANGRFIAFNSVKSLTGYDNSDSETGQPDSEIFLYDAATDELACASCNPDPSVGPTAPAMIRWPAPVDASSNQRAAYPQRNLSSDGQLFFESYDALLPEDTGGALSVYEYEAGQLQLISDGESEVESIFVDASPDGSDVFFMTAEPLLSRDGDTAYDIYDARVGGGFPGAGPAIRSCEGEAQCRPPAGTAPGFPTPLSALFHGPGNQRQKEQEQSKSCSKPTRRAKGLSRRARKLRRSARGMSDPKRAARLRKKAARLSRQARKKSRAAKRCRRGGPAASAGRRRAAHGRARRAHKRGHRARVRSSAAHLSSSDSAAPTAGAPEAESQEEVVEADTGPHAVTEGADEVTTTSAVLHGKVYKEVIFNSPECLVLGLVCHNSAGTPITACWFEYAAAPGYEQSGSYDRQADCEPPPPYPESDSVEIVEAPLSGLGPHITYHYRLVAKNQAGETGVGEDGTFMTEGTYEAPTIEHEAYSIVRQGDETFAATLTAQINPHGYETTCRVQYVADAKFRGSEYEDATTVPCAPATLPVGFGAEQTSATVSGLPPGARYHFRFIAENQEGETIGEDRTFITFAVESFSAAPSRLVEDPPGGIEQPYELQPPEPQDLQAGGHPYELNERLRLSTAPENPWGDVFPSFAVVNAKDIVTNLPPGLIGNPLATPRCAQHELIHATCSGATQVGVLRVEANHKQAGVPPPEYYELPLYNLVPPAGLAAQLGAPLPHPANAAAHVDAGVATGSGYGVQAAALNTISIDELISVTATIWGVPHDPAHNSERFCPRPNGSEIVTSLGGECPNDAELEADLAPFLRNPTSCSAAHVARLKVDAWQSPGDFVGASAEFPAMEGCEAVPFEPAFTLTPTSSEAASPTGLHVDLHLPQPGSPTGIGEADLRKAVVTLPEGLEVNPAGADGLVSCSESQFGFIEAEGAAIHTTPDPATCPEPAKIGSVEVSTPLLEHPLAGGVYAAVPYENPFGSLLAIYIAVDDPKTGVVVKLAGEVTLDPETGQITTTFSENPQLPFEDFRLNFFSGPRAPLKTAPTCGTFTTTANLTPWSSPGGANATPSSSFAIESGPNGSPCVGNPAQAPNHPAFEAGTLTPSAGAHSTFVLNLARSGDSQQIRGISATLPPGLTGRLAGIPYCPERQIVAAATGAGRHEAAHPDCPAASQVGTVTVAAGAGPKPLHVGGRAYLAGPYRGAPISLAIVTPAVAGPYDLGTVVVRTALYVDPRTTQIHAVSAPIPTMLEGIPLDVRQVAVKMDRPNLTLNPTSCDPMSIAGTALSALGQAASLSERFQVGGCETLPFAPELALNLRGPTKRTGHPALTAVLSAQPGEANIARAEVTLPRSEFLDQAHIKTICTRVQFAEGAGNGERCPPESVYGFARAETPLLDQPLQGPVFLRSSDHNLPDLVAALSGPASQPIHVELVGRVDSIKGAIRSTFEAVPDAPVSTFTLEMQGGDKGLLVNSTDLCTRKFRAQVAMDGHNGKLHESRPVLSNQCRRGRRHKHRHRRRHRHHHRRTGAKR